MRGRHVVDWGERRPGRCRPRPIRPRCAVVSPVMAEPLPSARFPTTHWSRVVSAADAAAPGAREALAELCAAYWYPLYAFIRRRGLPPEAAADLTQDYFARLLEEG